MAGPNDVPRWADDSDPAPTVPSDPPPADPNATQAIAQQELLDATTAGVPEPPAEPPLLPPPYQAAPPAWPTDPADDAPTTFQPPVVTAPTSPPSDPPGPRGPVPLETYDDDDGGNRTPLIVGIAVVVVVILLAATVGVFMLTDDDDETAISTAGDVVLEAAASDGTDPFTPNVAKLYDPDKIGGLSPSGRPADTDSPDGVTKIQTRKGTQPGLYGGTLDESSCDVAKLIDFLESEGVKGTAWASVQGIPPAEIADFVKDLTPAVLLEDTRVTNHGYADAKAVSLQSVLQAGTAVMIDDRGMPRVRCACGNPLLPPVPEADVADYTGDPWPGFDPGALGAVEPGEPTDVFVMTDIDTGKPFTRPAGTTGGEDSLITGTTTTTTAPSTTTTTAPSTTTTSSTTTSSTSTTTTTTPTTAPPTTAAPPTDVTSLGVVSASSECSADFPSSLGVDGDPTTSWFSAGTEVDGDSSVYSWTTLDPADQFVITDITLVGNGSNADPANRTDFGFESVTIEVLSGGTTTYSETFGLPGTPDPTITARPDALGNTVLLTFTGHESQSCAGFGELAITGSL